MVIMVSVCHGQTIFLKFGPAFSKLSYTSTTCQVSQQESIIGYDAIAGINYLNFKYFHLSSGFGFIQKGGIENYEIFQNDPRWVTETARLNFLTINTTFNLKVPILQIIEPYIFVGPRLDYLISYSENDHLLKDFNYFKVLNKVIYGIITGGGINFKVKSFQLGLVFDYYLNVNKLVDIKTDYTTNQISDNTFTINACFGYKF